MRKLGALLLAACTGCASIFNPGPDLVVVSTRPAGAEVFLDGLPLGRSPMVVPIRRSSKGVIRLELAGYTTRTIDLDKVANGVTFVNLAWIVFWPVVPLAFLIDAATGDIGKYPEDPLDVELLPKVDR